MAQPFRVTVTRDGLCRLTGTFTVFAKTAKEAKELAIGLAEDTVPDNFQVTSVDLTAHEGSSEVVDITRAERF